MGKDFLRPGWLPASALAVLVMLGLLGLVLAAKAALGHLGSALTVGSTYAFCAAVYAAFRCICSCTALPHFVLIESWPLFLAAFAFNKIVVDVNVNVAMSNTDFGTGGLRKYYQQRYLWPDFVPATTVSFNGTVELPEITFANLPAPDWFWLLAEWGFYLATLALTFYVLKEFFHADDDKPNLGGSSFEDGAYLCFAWQLNRHEGYRKILKAQVFFAVALPVVWVLELAFLFGEGDMAWWDVAGQLSILFETTWSSGMALIYSLARLGRYKIDIGTPGFITEAAVGWHEREAGRFLGDFAVNRSGHVRFGLAGFIGAFRDNSELSSKLLDALWQAQHGSPALLQKSLQRGANSDEQVQEFVRRAGAACKEAAESRRQAAEAAEAAEAAGAAAAAAPAAASASPDRFEEADAPATGSPAGLTEPLAAAK